QNLDTAAFATTLNDQLIAYCKQFGVDTGSTPTTSMYSSEIAASLPLGYDTTYTPTTKPPCPVVEYGSGGVVSTRNDMLAFLLYQMSTNCALYLQDVQSYLPSYCNQDAYPTTGFGWFIRPYTVNGRLSFLVSKDGGVSGFTSWIGFEARASETD